jgi:hypothetical protein
LRKKLEKKQRKLEKKLRALQEELRGLEERPESASKKSRKTPKPVVAKAKKKRPRTLEEAESPSAMKPPAEAAMGISERDEKNGLAVG